MTYTFAELALSAALKIAKVPVPEMTLMRTRRTMPKRSASLRVISVCPAFPPAREPCRRLSGGSEILMTSTPVKVNGGEQANPVEATATSENVFNRVPGWASVLHRRTFPDGPALPRGPPIP